MYEVKFLTSFLYMYTDMSFSAFINTSVMQGLSGVSLS